MGTGGPYLGVMIYLDDPNSREALLRERAAAKATTPEARNPELRWTEADAARAIDMALAILPVLGDWHFEGRIVPCYDRGAWGAFSFGEALQFRRVNSKVALEMGHAYGLPYFRASTAEVLPRQCLALKVKGKGCKTVENAARALFLASGGVFSRTALT